jgi:DNA-directed RNA polymerase subunit F
MTEKAKKKPRVDKRNNVWKVAEVLINNPNKTEKQIKEETWLWAGTVHRAKKELEKNGAKDPTINYIVWNSKEYLKKLSKLNLAKLEKTIKENIVEKKDWTLAFIEWQDIHIKDLVEFNKVGKEEMARLTVLGWDITDKDWWLKEQTISDKQLQAIESLKSFMKWS